jgi:hypothetical protein
MDRRKNTNRQHNVDENVRSAYYESFPDARDGLIDAKIRAAQEQGKFDNLPGFGKPLPRDEGYEMAGEHWLGNHILKQTGYLPIWLQLRKEIAAERREVEAALAQFRGETCKPAGSISATLQQLEDRYVQLATAINTKIDQHNDRCPNTQLLNRFPEDTNRRWK